MVAQALGLIAGVQKRAVTPRKNLCIKHAYDDAHLYISHYLPHKLPPDPPAHVFALNNTRLTTEKRKHHHSYSQNRQHACPMNNTRGRHLSDLTMPIYH